MVRREIAPISAEEAEERERVLTETLHNRRIVRPTRKKYLHQIDQFRTFCLWAQKDADEYLRKGGPIPSKGLLCMFKDWEFQTSIGMIREHITLRSSKNSWYTFKSAYQRETGNFIPTKTTNEVREYIKTELREKGLALVRREKHLADQLDVRWLLEYLWCYDKHQFLHPRQILQISFPLLLLVYTGTRSGSIVESSAYRGSNQALCYKDFQLIGLRAPGGGMELVLKVRFRYDKGKRQDEKEEDESSQYKWVTFHKDHLHRGRCPITHFLGLAFADGAFEGPKEPSDLEHLFVSSHKHSMLFKIEKEKADIPIFRKCLRDGTISESRAMSYDDLAHELVELGYRVGFRDMLKTFNLRRGTANTVDGDVEISANQYEQLLSHGTKVMGEHYISNISAIDVQGVVNGEGQRKDHIQKLRGMSLNLNLRATNLSLPFEENQRILDSPEYLRLQSIEQDLRNRVQRTNTDDHLAKEYQTAVRERKTYYNRHYSQASRRHRQDYFQNTDTEEMREQIKNGKLGISTHTEDGLVVEFEFVSSSYFPDRHYIASSFWTSLSTIDALSEAKLLASLVKLGNPEPFVLYYPGEEPRNGDCPVCGIQMESLSTLDRPGHIHSCNAKKQKQVNEYQFKKDYSTACKWGNCRKDFLARAKYLPSDFAHELSEPHLRRWAKSQESKRLYDSRKRAAAELKRGTRTRKSISAHLKKHIQNSTQCLWNDCREVCSSEWSLRRHLLHGHHLNVRNSAFIPQFCYEHPSLGWFLDEFDWENHCKLHLGQKSTRCKLEKAHGAVLSGFQCPYCFRDESSRASDRFTQFTERGTFNRHMSFHEKKTSVEAPLTCPFPDCKTTFQDFAKLHIHFADVHSLSPRGYVRSRGYQLRNSNTGGDEDLDDIDRGNIIISEGEGENDWDISSGDEAEF